MDEDLGRAYNVKQEWNSMLGNVINHAKLGIEELDRYANRLAH